MALEDAFQHITDQEEREALISIARLEVARRRRRAVTEGERGKHCPRCSTEKPRSDFGVSATRYDGLQGFCRPCRSRRHPRNRKAPA